MTSFNVTWNNDNKIAGKVFARKRKLKADVTNSSINQNLIDSSSVSKEKKVDKHFSIQKKLNKPKKSEKKSDILEKINLKDTSEIKKTTKLVKRKQKKDKLLAKLAADSQQNTSVPQPKQKEHSLFSVERKDVYVKSNNKGISVVEEVFSSGKKFSDLDIHRFIVSNLEKIGYTTLTNVQDKSIPVILSGQNVLVSTYICISKM